MLERLFGSMINGPAMNCRPHASRQRIDFAQLARLQSLSPGDILAAILGPEGKARVPAKAAAPAKSVAGAKAVDEEDEDDSLTPEEKAARKAWSEQQSLVTKLRVIADDARTYEQDTGVHVLEIGFPLLSLPPGTFGGRAGVATRRILAPVAYVPVTLTVKAGAKQVVEIAGRGEGVDRVRPNPALLAWLDQQSGQPVGDLFADDAGDNPWREIRGLVREVAGRVDVGVPAIFQDDAPPEAIDILATPRNDDDASGKAIVCSAVLGLFPTSNQGLLRDTRELLAEGAPDGSIERFVRLGAALDEAPVIAEPDAAQTEIDAKKQAAVPRAFRDERLISRADPCQTRAVRLAQKCRALVIHGPPGTGKSQTIANIIGDHLARDERVLFVCDKRTALDVVADRLQSLGLGSLLATVHDPQRDQREFYRSVREQLDALNDSPVPPATEHKLTRTDEELQTLHDELSAYYAKLMGERGGPGSFHHLVGQWLGESTAASLAAVDDKALQEVPAADFDRYAQRLKEVLERGEAVTYVDNPWTRAAGVSLSAFLQTPMNDHRAAVARAAAIAQETDAAIDPLSPPFDAEDDLLAQAADRRTLADDLAALPPVDAKSVSHWTAQPADAVAAAASALAALGEAEDQFAANPVDPELLARSQSLSEGDVTGVPVEALRQYARAFRDVAARYAAAVRAAGDDAEATVVRWLTASPAKSAGALKRLDAAATLAKDVESSSLDPSLSARVADALPTPKQITEQLAALNAYLDIAGSWTAIFKGGVKKAAEPAVKGFGLSLSPASAQKVRQFLTDLQKRGDLRHAIEAATGDTFDGPPEDDELLQRYRRHHAVLSTLAGDRPGGEAADIDAAAADAVNGVVASELRRVDADLSRFGLPNTAAAAERLAAFREAVALRMTVQSGLVRRAAPWVASWPLLAEEALAGMRQVHLQLLRLLEKSRVGTPVGQAVARALLEADVRAGTIAALRAAPLRAKQILQLAAAADEAGLLSPAAKEKVVAAARTNRSASGVLSSLAEKLDTLEGVLRVGDGIKRLPPTLSQAAAKLLTQRLKAADGFSTVRRSVLTGEIGRRLREHPELQAIDGHRLQASFERFRQLSERKKENVLEDVIARWNRKQKQRLLAGTGTRLNAVGADLRRRLTSRGEKAMRLRQVLAHGRQAEGGDPLFDLRPVWMASPETVAQLFGREPVFDVIVFDEASQCRLEEALPVLTRGKRIVIAGDPKQLPPPRFFESAVASSEEIEGESEQELFEAHQGEVEDLLTAALSLSGVEECYLNVHYRSRNSDLIGFSNDHFYGSRLQAIPGHPSSRIRYAPITLYRADGVYEKRRNVAEATRVCQIVHDLLRRAKPPSIGIACFNMVQRDLIVETLEEWAEKDADFAAKLSEARERRGHGSSEALFVKNLENVQGDERDHLIISTTYGPDKSGKFRRACGPLGMAGGGRRLNVLVTRAREELHVVTSIPRSAYAALPDVPQGSSPSGAWLLFAYLKFAEQLQDEYETNHRILESSGPLETASSYVKPSKSPSQFARALGHTLAKSAGTSSEVHWGNEGFGVDLALLDPNRADDVTLGVQCDMTRFAGTDDPVEWDAFQNSVHESQGWRLHRVWTPHFFRDPEASLGQLREGVDEASTSPT